VDVRSNYSSSTRFARALCFGILLYFYSRRLAATPLWLLERERPGIQTTFADPVRARIALFVVLGLRRRVRSAMGKDQIRSDSLPMRSVFRRTFALYPR